MPPKTRKRTREEQAAAANLENSSAAQPLSSNYTASKINFKPKCRIKTIDRYNNLVALYKRVITDKIRAGEYDSIKSDINNLYRLTLEKEIDLNYLSACRSAIKHIYLDSLRGKIETDSIARISEILITLEVERVKPANDRIARKINFREAAFEILKTAIEKSANYLKHNHLHCSKLNEILEQNFAPLVSKEALETAGSESENSSGKLRKIYNTVQELLSKYSLNHQATGNLEKDIIAAHNPDSNEKLDNQLESSNFFLSGKTDSPKDSECVREESREQDNNHEPLLLGDFDTQ